MRRILAASLLVAMAAACSRDAPPAGEAPPPGAAVGGACAPAPPPACEPCAAPGEPAGPDAPEARALPRCFPGDGPMHLRSLRELHGRALRAEEEGAHERMLACAEEALRLAEDDVASNHLRAEALLALGRIDEAKEAFVLAAALAPADPDVLAGAADLYANVLPPSRRHTLTALAWAERGLAGGPEPDARLRLHLVAGWAHSDLGNHRQALAHAQAASALRPGDPDALVAQGRALFELTRFRDAAAALERVLARSPDDAEAHHLLGLALERIEDRAEAAEAHFAAATRLDPEGFPAPVAVDPAALERLVRDELAALPAGDRLALARSGVPVRILELPELEDLRAEVPPLSPTAVGMFRGPPLGVEPEAPREILLFSRNLARVARNLPELREQVRITLLHELGHLAGDGEAELRARGLE